MTATVAIVIVTEATMMTVAVVTASVTGAAVSQSPKIEVDC